MTIAAAITTEEDLYHWLLSYLERTGSSRLYPSELVEFARFFFREVPNSIDCFYLLEHLGVDQREPDEESGLGSGVIAALMERVSGHQQQAFSSSLIELLAQLLEVVCHGPVECSDANHFALALSGLLDSGYLAELEDDEWPKLVTTELGARQLGVHIAAPIAKSISDNDEP